MTDLLAGPRGRRLCWAVLGLPEIGLFDVPHADIEAAVDTTVQRLSAADAAMDARLFDALGRSVDFARYWQEPDECDEAIAAESVRELLRPVADAVLGCPLTAWWATPLSGPQLHVGFVLDDRPTDPPLTGASESLRDWHAEQTRLNTRFGNLDAAHWERTSGTWWSAPSHPARLVITTRILERGPVRLSLVEDSLGWTRAVCSPVSPVRGPTAFEIGGPADWADLVMRFPLDVSESRGPDWWRATGRRGRWSIPDWPSVAGSYDAVHLSVLGYLTTAGVAVPVGDAASVLAGWSPDETYWLADVLQLTGSPETWSRGTSDTRWHRVD